MGFVQFKQRGIGFGETNFAFRLLFELRRVNLLALEESLIRVVQFEQDALQSVHRRIFEKVAVGVGIVAPHRELLHHCILAELFVLASAVAGLLHRQSTIPDPPLAASILAHQAFLSACWLQPVVGEALLYLHGSSTFPLLRISRALATDACSSFTEMLCSSATNADHLG